MSKSVIFLGISFLIYLFLVINSQYTVWPEMILYPYFINNGFKLYQDLINPYFPLLSLILSWFFIIFGISVINLKILTWVLVLISYLGVYSLTLKLSGNKSKSLLASICYLTLQYSFGGNGLWFELALTPFLVWSIWSIYAKDEKRYLLLSGFLLSLAFFIKQNAALFLFPLLILVYFKKKDIKDVSYFLFPQILIIILIGIYLWLSNIINQFVEWAIILPITYTSQPGFVLLPTKKQLFLIVFPLIVAVLSIWNFKKDTVYKLSWILILISAFSFNFPRYENFHAQVLVALAAIWIGLLSKRAAFGCFLLILILFTSQFGKTFMAEDRFLDRDMYNLANKISKYQSVYLINSPDLAYFFANKLPPKPWAINFPWYFEKPGFAEKFVQGIDNQQTKYIVIRDLIGGGKYDLGNYIPDQVSLYVNDNYKKVEQEGGYSIWQRKLISQ